jgi:Xaa-Pro aminopeptidase
MNSHRQKLKTLRNAMKSAGVDAYIIPATDPHLGEYVPEHWRVISWLTGFTGSAANVVVTARYAGLWTDSRYFIQAEQELEGSGIELVKLKIPHTPEYIEWIAGNLRSKSVVAFDGRVIPSALLSIMKEAFFSRGLLINTECDLITPIWSDRPDMPRSSAFDHLVGFAGIDRGSKIISVRERMEAVKADYHLLTSPDDIMWMLNIRGNDVKYSPLVTSFALVTPDQVLLFADDDQIPPVMKRAFDNDGIVILPYDVVGTVLSGLPASSSLLLHKGTTSAALYSSVNPKCAILEDISIPTRLKAVKNSVEIENIKATMVKDGVALTKFFFWLETNIGLQKITEVSAAEKLLGFRMEQEGCVGPSFATISAWNEHAALPHYTPSPDRETELGPTGIYLLDSGGQYYGGTTDVTRCVVFGEPSARQKHDFTLALKGTIALASVKFPLGTRGYQIEVLARKALWDNGLNYGHGTGHGVGFFLNVHEGPQTIGTGASGDLKTILEPGMLTADEPAVYRQGEYGFRTENLILCVEDELTDYGQFLRFETVTLCFIDTRLIDTELLTPSEALWIDSYHQRVFDTLAPLLGKAEQKWLRNKTQKLIIA